MRKIRDRDPTCAIHGRVRVANLPWSAMTSGAMFFVTPVSHHVNGDECVAGNHTQTVFMDGRDNRPAMTDLL